MTAIIGSKECSYERILHVLCNHSRAEMMEWRSLASQLKIPVQEIDKLADEHGELHDEKDAGQLFIDMLSLWVLKNNSDATLSNLLAHMQILKWNHAVDQLRKEFAVPIFDNWRDSGAQGLPERNPIDDSLPATPKYYVPRILLTRNRLSSEIFSPQCKDIKVFTGIERHRLTELARGQLTDSSRSQVYKKQITVRFIILEQKDDWKILCEKTDKPIHLIHYENGSFIWVRSKGGMHTLQEIVKTTDQIRLTEEDFVKEIERANPFRVNQTLCIVHSPGMGKTMLLSKLGRMLQEMFTDRYVCFIRLSEWITEIHKLLKGSNDKEKLILEVTSKYLRIKHSYLLAEINSASSKPETKLELMLDGLDEVHSRHLPSAYDCLEILMKSCCNYARIWISSRAHLLLDLENRLNVMAYKIQTFSESDQVTFLTSYWSSSKTGLDARKLYSFASQCVSLVKLGMGKRSDEDIFGVPLQCMLIGEVYENEAHDHADPDNTIISESDVGIISNVGFKPTSIADLFEGVISRKFSELKKFQHSEFDYSGNQIWQLHVYHSLQGVFEDDAQDIMDDLSTEADIEEEIIINAGFIQSFGEGGKARFIHRSFAEYFIAWYFVEVLTSGFTTSHVKFIIECILRTKEVEILVFHQFPKIGWHFQEDTICYFLDLILLKMMDKNKILSDLACDYQPDEETLSRILMGCCYSDRVSILKLLHLQDYVQSYPNPFFDEIFLIVMVMFSSVELMKSLFKWHPGLPLLNTHKISSAENKSFLHVVACHGHFAEFEYLLKFHDFEEMVNRQDKSMSDLVHYCVMDTDKAPESIAREHNEILNVLVKLDGELLEAKTSLQETPLLRHDVHFLLILELVKLGANVLAKDVGGRNFLHIDFWGVTKEMGNPYLTIFEYISREKIAEMVQMRTQFGDTILHNPSILSNADEETLLLFHQSGADLKAKSILGLSVLGCAIRNINWHRHTIDTDKATKILKTLVRLGANYSEETYHGNCLHIAAASGSMTATVYFIEEFGMEINIMDKRNRTPLYHAITGGVEGVGRYEVGKFLKELGGVLTEPVDRSALLFDRISKLDMLGVKLLLEETDLNLQDMSENGMTPLHCVFDTAAQIQVTNNEIEWTRLEIIRILLERGIEMNAVNLRKETPLQHIFKTMPEELTIPQYNLMVAHGAICSGEIANSALFWLSEISLSEVEFEEMCEPLIIQGGKMTCLDADGNSLLHLAAKLKYAERVKFLVEKYCLPVNIKNVGGDTPLHEAMKFPENTSLDNLPNIRMFEAQVRKIEKERWETVMVLVNCGADVNILNDKDQSSLSFYWTTFDIKKSDFESNTIGYNARDLYSTSTTNHIKNFRENIPNRLLPDISSPNPASFNSSSEDLSMINAAMFIKLLKIFLLEKDFHNIHVCDQVDGNTILHTFFLHCFLTTSEFHYLIELLIQAKCVDAISIYGEHQVTPLHIALKKFEVDCETVELLHSNGVDFDILDENGMSVFWYCIHSKNKPSVIKHLQKFCNWRAPNIHGRNVLHDAVLCRDISTIQLLDTDNELRYSFDNNGLTPLHMALQRKIDQDSEEEVNEKLELINNLMTDNPHLRELDKKGNTIVHHAACFLEHTLFHEFIEIFVKMGFADLLKNPGADGYSFLHYAVARHETELRTLEIFSAHGFDFTATSDDRVSILVFAVKGGRSFEFLKTLINFGAEWRQQSNQKRSVLHTFSFLGSVDMLCYFLPKLDDLDINAEDGKGNTLLHYALANTISQTRDAVQLLLEKGANPNSTNKAGYSPLHLAIKTKVWLNQGTAMGPGFPDISPALQIIKMMLNHDLNIRAKDTNGCNFIHLLISSCKFAGLDTFKVLGNFLIDNNCTDLLSEKATMESKAGKLEQTPMHMIMEKTWEIDVHTLFQLNKNGVNFDIQDSLGRTVLHYVASRKISPLVLEALTKLCDWKILDIDGNSIFHHATMNGNITTLCHLIHLDITGELSRAKNINGATPLHFALSRKSARDNDLYETTEIVLRLLPLYKEFINCQDNEGDTVLSYAVQERRSVSLLRVLVKFGADWRIPDNRSSTVLHHAASGGHVLALKYFIMELGAIKIINEVDEDGDTPLHCAIVDAEENILEMVRILRDNGAKVDISNDKGETPLAAGLLSSQREMEPELITLLEKKD